MIGNDEKGQTYMRILYLTYDRGKVCFFAAIESVSLSF